MFGLLNQDVQEGIVNQSLTAIIREASRLSDLPGRSGRASFLIQSMPLPALTIAEALLEAFESRNCDRFAQQEL
jgi:hypothetical protein